MRKTRRENPDRGSLRASRRTASSSQETPVLYAACRLRSRSRWTKLQVLFPPGRSLPGSVRPPSALFASFDDRGRRDSRGHGFSRFSSRTGLTAELRSHVVAAEEEDASGVFPVAAGPPRLLEIVLKGARNVGMDDKADVRAWRSPCRRRWCAAMTRQKLAGWRRPSSHRAFLLVSNRRGSAPPAKSRAL